MSVNVAQCEFKEGEASLNYVTADARSLYVHVTSRTTDFGNVSVLDAGYAAAAFKHKKSLPKSILNAAYPGLEWTASYWPFVGSWKREAKEVFKIRDKKVESWRVWNYDQCYRKNTWGKVYVSKDGKDYYHSRCHCGERGCLWCDKKNRERLAGEWCDRRKDIVAKHPDGFKGFLSLDFTLAQEIEAMPFEDPEKEKALIECIVRYVKEIFGLKARANLAMNVSIHPIGDKDLFRDRWHVHVDIIPAVIENGKFRWIEPVKVAKHHSSKEWRLDLDWSRERWSELVSEVFGRELKVIQPQVSFIPYSPDTVYWRKSLKKGQEFKEIFWRVVKHRLSYDIRSFIEDFSDGVLMDTESKRFAIKAERFKEKRLYVMDARVLVERYKWVREKRKVRARGWAQCLGKYREILGIQDKEAGPAPDVVGPVVADVEIMREREYDLKGKTYVWNLDQVYKFRCPVTDQDKELSARDMKEWKWKAKETSPLSEKSNEGESPGTRGRTLYLFDRGG